MELLELRLLLEELCCDLCRYRHADADGEDPNAIEIHREVALGGGRGFADIAVRPQKQAAYFVEVKFGYSDDELANSLLRKYGQPLAGELASARGVILLVDRAARPGLDVLITRVRESLAPGLALEVWDESVFAALVKQHFDVTLSRIAPEVLLDVRTAVDHAKGQYAFGTDPAAGYLHDPLKAQLLWHFGPWRLRELRERRKLDVREILNAGEYEGVAILLADLCSFSSYVRDTSDAAVIRQNLTSFYSKARYEILNHGGMLYQFVGDEVIGFFGLPDKPDRYIEAAFAAARVLAAVGRSVAEEWQKQIDRVQPKAGIHVGMALGNVHLLPLRPFSRTHCGFIADSINIAARLMNEGGADEIVVTNSLYKRLEETSRKEFTPLEPVDAKNVGQIRAWKTKVQL